MVNKTSKLVHALMMVMYMTVAFLVHAEDVKSAGISELFASANNALQSGDFQAAIPILEEVVERTSGIDQDQGRQTCQTCRFRIFPFPFCARSCGESASCDSCSVSGV